MCLISGTYYRDSQNILYIDFNLQELVTKQILYGRCDLVGVGVFSGHGIKMPWTPALYISSLILSLVAIRTENTLINFKNYVDEIISKEKVSQ